MTYDDLTNIINRKISRPHRRRNPEIVIVLDEPGIPVGGRTEIKDVVYVAEWDTLKIIPDEPIVRRGHKQEDVRDIIIKKSCTERKYYCCPKCDSVVRKADNYCSQCGQRIKLNPDFIPIKGI